MALQLAFDTPIHFLPLGSDIAWACAVVAGVAAWIAMRWP